MTTDARIIASMTKIFNKWFKKLGLPNAIDKLQTNIDIQTKYSFILEIEIKGLDEESPSVLRVLNNGTTLLIFDEFPPRSRSITKEQSENFSKVLSDLIGKKVIQDDRELFIIFDDSQKTIDSLVSFLKKIK